MSIKWDTLYFLVRVEWTPNTSASLWNI